MPFHAYLPASRDRFHIPHVIVAVTHDLLRVLVPFIPINMPPI